MFALFICYHLKHFFHGSQMGDLESFGCWCLDVRLDTGAFPVRFGDWTYGSPRRDKDTEVVRNTAAASRIGPAAGRLAYRRRALEVFEVVSELLGSREGPIRGQYIYRLGRSKTLARDMGQRPPLVRAVVGAEIEVVQMHRLAVKQVARDERHHSRVTSAVPSQVDYESIGVGEKIHCSGSRVRTYTGRGKLSKFKVAHITRKPFDFLKPTVGALQEFAKSCLLLGRRLVI